MRGNTTVIRYRIPKGNGVVGHVFAGLLPTVVLPLFVIMYMVRR